MTYIMKLGRKVRDLKRFKDIASVLLIIESEDILINKLGLGRVFKKHDNIQDKTVQLREGFEKLGATFIKLGQLLSLRPDLIPSVYCEELRKLQDHVEPFSSNTAKEIIEKELGKKIKTIFKSFDPKPIAAASIGQVHKAQLKNGKHVVIKVKRPNIEKKFSTDMDILLYLAQYWEKHARPEIVKPTQIVQEFKRYTDQELDYINEARNIEKFYNIFLTDPEVIVPQVYWDYTTSNVLVMQRITGKRIDQSLPDSPEKRHELMQKIAHLEFVQIFENGVFHADPHPGNIFITRAKKIALIDFGIVGVFDEELKSQITDLFIALIEKDLPLLTSSMTALGMADDNEINERELREDLREYLGKYYSTELKVMKISEIFERLIFIARKHKLLLPSNFVLFGKSLVTLEGLGEEIDEHFNFVESAKPYVQELIAKKTKPAALAFSFKKFYRRMIYFTEKFPKQSNELVHDVKVADRSLNRIHEDIETLNYQMDKSSHRMVLGLIISALVIGGALMTGVPQIKILGFPALPLLAFVAAAIFGLSLLDSPKHRRKIF